MNNEDYFYRVRVFRDETSNKEIEGTRYDIEISGNGARILDKESRQRVIALALEGFVRTVIPDSSKSVFEIENYLSIEEEKEEDK